MQRPKFLVQQPPNLSREDFLMTVRGRCDGIQFFLHEEDCSEHKPEVEIRSALGEDSLLFVHLHQEPFPLEVSTAVRIIGQNGCIVKHFYQDAELPTIATPHSGLENARFGCHVNYHNLWLERCERSSSLPIFDIPRLFRETIIDEALSETIRLLNKITRPYLHLIDFFDSRQERQHFTPFGHGILTEILDRIRWRTVPEVIVLEFEDVNHSLESVEFLRNYFSQLHF